MNPRIHSIFSRRLESAVASMWHAWALAKQDLSDEALLSRYRACVRRCDLLKERCRAVAAPS